MVAGPVTQPIGEVSHLGCQTPRALLPIDSSTGSTSGRREQSTGETYAGEMCCRRPRRDG